MSAPAIQVSGFPDDQHDSLHRRVALDAAEQLRELGAHAGGDLVHRLAGQVDRDDCDAVLVIQP